VKKTLILVCLAGLLSQNVVAQNVTLNVTDTPLREVLREIQNQTDYRFVYNDNAIGASNPVSITVSSQPLRAILGELFTQNNITYTISGRQIVLSPSTPPEREAPVTTTPNRQRQVTGRVVCATTGETLPFVTVMIEGTTTGVVSSMDGDFSIMVPSDETVLRISYMGFETMEIPVGSATHLSVRMRLEATELDGVIVTGFQTISRERSAGAYSIVSGQSIAERAALGGSIIGSLEGLTTGLSVNHGTGEDRFLIRGTNSVNAARQPLFVVDGVPMSAENVDLMINEHDIASVTVLRDATAASIWGAQAANGVVVISTKRGRDTDRRFRVSYSGTITVRGRPDFDYLNFMPSDMFVRTAREIFDPVTFPYNSIMSGNLGLSGNSFPLILPHEVPMYEFLLGNISEGERNRRLAELAELNNRSQIENLLMQPDFLIRNNVSIMGGSSNYSIHGSFMHEHNQGVSLTNTNRYALNVRQDFNMRPWLSFDLTTNLVLTSGNNGLLPEFTDINTLLPYMMLRDANGNNLSHAALRYHESIMLDAQARSHLNLDYVPMDELGFGFNTNSSLNARINAGLTIRLMEGLNFEGRYQYQRNNGLSEIFRDHRSHSTLFEIAQFTTPHPTIPGAPPTYHIQPDGGRFTSVAFSERSWTVRNQLSLDRTFDNARHSITALVGTEVRLNNRATTTTNLRSFNPQTLVYQLYDERRLITEGISGVLVVPGGLGRATLPERMFVVTDAETRFVSFYSNASYTHLNRYSFNASIRVDQSNLFGSDPSVQFRPVWAMGVVWNMGHEDFMRNISNINRLNLRLSYGVGGNSPGPGQGGSFDILEARNNANFQGLGTGFVILTPANNQLVWERTRTLNFGVDVSMFHHRINASLDIYDKKTTDLLGQVPLDPTTGWNTALGNLGTLTNRGFELSLNTRNIQNRNFSWQTALTLTHNRNKVVELYNQTAITPTNKVNQSFLQGYAASSIFAFRWAGLDALGDPQVWNIDENGNQVRVKLPGDLTSLDAVMHMGSSQPLWFGGLTNRFTYKNFELSFLFIYNLGHVMRRRDGNFYSGRLSQNIDRGFDNRWRRPGDEAYTNVPSYVANANYSASRRNLAFFHNADINVVSASYIKLRDLSLSYTLPNHITDKLSLQSVRIRVQAGNLFYWAANRYGIDPEAYSYRTAIRQMRFGPTFSAGLTVNFR